MGASEKRFIGLVCPTGFGKTGAYLAYSILALEEKGRGGRVAILTSTKLQQSQIEKDLRDMPGMVDVRGKSNYACLIGDEDATVDEGPCQSGFHCEYRDLGCPYYDRVRLANTAKIVVTNYSFWLHTYAHGKGIGGFDILICDEAHDLVDELAGFLSVKISDADARSFLHEPPDSLHRWSYWAKEGMGRLDDELAFLEKSKTAERSTISRLRRARSLSSSLSLLLRFGEESWTVERMKQGTRWDLTHPGPLAERFVFHGIPKVIFSSATVRAKTFDLLGIEKDEIEVLEYPSTFPISRRPVYVVTQTIRKEPESGLPYKTPRMNFRTTPQEMKDWLELIDAFIEPRLDRRGIVGTVSFERARYILENSRHREWMLVNESGSDGVQKALIEYRSRLPSILVSPSVTTGIDLPYTDCEWIVIAKIPFPDMRSKVLQARSKIDPDYPAYIAGQVMVQASGRGMRAEDDLCEVGIVDGNFGWYLNKYAEFTPRWWRTAVRRVTRWPSPPPPLESRSRLR